MASRGRPTVRTHGASRPWADLPIVMASSALVACCMLFVVMASPADAPSGEPSDAASPPSAHVEAAEPDVGNEVIGSYQAISQSTDPDRAENVRLAAEAIDGTVIEPGATFSFNECVGNTAEDERYRDAAVISGDEMDIARGGGICQVSTALYIAALKADMEIVERHPHSIASDYAPVGLDATLVYGVMDLRIRNAGESSVRISAQAVGQTVEVSLLGDALEAGETVDATSKIVDRYTDGSSDDPDVHYVAEAYRVYYRDGVVERSDLLSVDTYLAPESSGVVLSEGSVDPSK